MKITFLGQSLELLDSNQGCRMLVLPVFVTKTPPIALGHQ